LYKMLKTYRKVDAIICPSKFMKQKLATNPLLADKLITLYNFLDAEPPKQTAKEDYVLYFGRYSEEKGVRTLLKVCEELPDIKFVFAGGGPLKEEVSKVGNITDRGFLKGEELKNTIAQARFSVFSSEWYENCPFTVMETQKYGTPIVASNIGGVPELVKDGVTGSLFEAGNKTQMKEKILELWENKELLEKYTENCKYVDFDTTAEYCGKLLVVYKKAGA
ncbi:MAG: glycosyltransferase family 4 protein, partial [Lachnospiraceae bacterium]|nr:glycosyltransferase family 4 protein [Lachnospiraceae bacterium]